MDLLEAIRRDVLKQKEEEAVNFFSRVDDFREFIEMVKPNADVTVTIKMCCLSSDRLNGDHGMRVTLIDTLQHGVFEDTVTALEELTAIKRKPYLAQITVWDAKAKKGANGKPFMLFRPGAVYMFRQVEGVSFYADIPKGTVQFKRGNNDKITELWAPANKRKTAPGTPKKNGKGKLRKTSPALSASIEENNDEDDEGLDVTMDTESKTEEEPVFSIKTRGNAPVHA